MGIADACRAVFGTKYTSTCDATRPGKCSLASKEPWRLCRDRIAVCQESLAPFSSCTSFGEAEHGQNSCCSSAAIPQNFKCFKGRALQQCITRHNRGQSLINECIAQDIVADIATARGEILGLLGAKLNKGTPAPTMPSVPPTTVLPSTTALPQTTPPATAGACTNFQQINIQCLTRWHIVPLALLAILTTNWEPEVTEVRPFVGCI